MYVCILCRRNTICETNFPFRLTVLRTAPRVVLAFRPMPEVSGGFLLTPWHNQLNMMHIQTVVIIPEAFLSNNSKRLLDSSALDDKLITHLDHCKKLCRSRVYNLNRFWQGTPRLSWNDSSMSSTRVVVASTIRHGRCTAGMINVKPEVGDGKSVGSCSCGKL